MARDGFCMRENQVCQPSWIPCLSREYHATQVYNCHIYSKIAAHHPSMTVKKIVSCTAAYCTRIHCLSPSLDCFGKTDASKDGAELLGQHS